MIKQRCNNVNARGFQEQIVDQNKIEELFKKIKRVKRTIQVYEKGFSASDYLPKGSSVRCT